VYSPENVRILHRAIYWAAAREREFSTWLCSNLNTECAYYAGKKTLVVVNNTSQPQTTSVTAPDGNCIEVSLAAHGSQILEDV
jgi:hypothetical protein